MFPAKDLIYPERASVRRSTSSRVASSQPSPTKRTHGIGKRLSTGIALASIKLWLPLSTRQDRIEIYDHDSLVELDQVLKDQLTPAISARLHKQSTFRKPAKFDRRKTEIFRKRTNLRCGVVIVARQEHDSPATMYGRILVKDGSDQMVEAPNCLVPG
jgi:hypothetical protein